MIGLVVFRNSSGSGWDWHTVDATEWCKRYQGQLRASKPPTRRVADFGSHKLVPVGVVASRKLGTRKLKFLKLSGTRRPVGIFVRA